VKWLCSQLRGNGCDGPIAFRWVELDVLGWNYGVRLLEGTGVFPEFLPVNRDIPEGQEWVLGNPFQVTIAGPFLEKFSMRKYFSITPACLLNEHIILAAFRV
jgi:hypothetical protein